MSISIKKEDLRKKKTRKSLYTALSSLLNNRSFKKITVTDICQEALIGRAAFYTYYLDKYDLLKYWLMDLWSKNMHIAGNYNQIEKVVNYHICENKSVLNHLFYEADNETLGILFDFVLSTLNLDIEKNDNGETWSKNVVLANFCAGGMISYLSWQVNNKFPSDVHLMNTYLYEIINKFQEW